MFRFHTLREEVMHKRFAALVGVVLSAIFILTAYWAYDSGIGTVRKEQEKQKIQTERRYENINQRYEELNQRIFRLEKSKD